MDYNKMKKKQLLDICEKYNIKGKYQKKTKPELVEIIQQNENSSIDTNQVSCLKKDKPCKKLDEDGLREYYTEDLRHYHRINDLNNKYNGKARSPGLSEIVSENMCKFILKKNGTECTNGTTGDLIDKDGNKYECKSFTSDGPISFGPTEKWDKLIFMDARQWYNDIYKTILIDLKNTDEKWENIKVNKTETFSDQCKEGRRPRIGWDKIHKQLLDLDISITIIFEDKFDNIFI